MKKISINSMYITNDEIEKSLSVLIDNGIEQDEAETVLQAIGYTLLDTELFPDETQDWITEYKEDIPDSLGSNTIGMIREQNFGGVLFFHIVPDSTLTHSVCKIFDSLASLYADENELCSYDWCEENELLVFEKLNSLSLYSADWYGENCVLSTIDFRKYKD